jgi:hypothetical protein
VADVFADLRVGAPGTPEVEVESGTDFHDDGLFDVEDVAPEVDPSIVRGLLASMGTLVANSRLADDDVEDHWRFTDRELDDLTPPLTRIVNRRPKLRRAIQHGDEMTVAVQLAGYVGRNLEDRRQAKEYRADDDVEPEAGPPSGEVHGGSGGVAGSGAGGWNGLGAIPTAH